MLSRCARSIDASGSSIRSRLGFASSARPSATRCFSPPDSRDGRRAQERAEIQQIDDLGGIDAASQLSAEPASEQQVLADGQVREQSRLLEHVADPPLVRRSPDARRRVGDAPHRRAARGRDRAATRRR